MKNLKLFFIIFATILIIIFVLLYCFSSHKEETINYANDLLLTNSKQDVSNSKIIVHITGQVNFPGLVELSEGSRISDAIEMAGGITLEADINKINLAYELSDGQKIYIPSIYDAQDISYIFDSAGENIIIDSVDNLLININKATQTELETLTGIGPSTANNILTYRKQNGNFSCIEDLKNVPGIGEAKFEIIKDFICVK